MYSGSGYSDWEIGDITVIVHNGVYHLFHLIIPNHDYIAHAISKDGISWKRVKNALFVGDPGQWDDDMLWTMHVIEGEGRFRMYYTGLKRKDKGRISRIGLAESVDLIDWQKKDEPWLPVEPLDGYYENINDNPRGWLSFRDPYYFEDGGETYLLVCTRINWGPLSRRGCVGLLKFGAGKFDFCPPLLAPMVYDDVECPCVFKLNNRYYLIGSIREDIKVRYWFSDEFRGEYHSFHSDVLLPQGNYAARVLEDNGNLLVYNFFYTHGKINSLRVLPPPKQLDTDEKGRLVLKSYYRWEMMVQQYVIQENFGDPELLFSNPSASFEKQDHKWICSSKSGYEIFYIKKPSDHFMWEGILTVEGLGKFGLVAQVDKEANGYFISFDILNGLVQLRAWGFNPANNRENFIFENIQTNIFSVPASKSFHFCLICYGNYIELSIDGFVKITLIDYRWSGQGIGLYTASSIIALQESVFKILPDVESEYASQEEAERSY